MASRKKKDCFLCVACAKSFPNYLGGEEKPCAANSGTEYQLPCHLGIPWMWVLRRISGKQHCLNLTVHFHVKSFLLLSTAGRLSHSEKCPLLGERGLWKPQSQRASQKEGRSQQEAVGRRKWTMTQWRLVWRISFLSFRLWELEPGLRSWITKFWVI